MSARFFGTFIQTPVNALASSPKSAYPDGARPATASADRSVHSSYKHLLNIMNGWLLAIFAKAQNTREHTFRCGKPVDGAYFLLLHQLAAKGVPLTSSVSPYPSHSQIILPLSLSVIFLRHLSTFHDIRAYSMYGTSLP